MWTFWRLLEGEVLLNGTSYRTADGRDPPVLHVELMNTPVVTEDGHRFPDQHFYTYVRYAAERVGAPGVQGGTIPIRLGPKAVLDPYGHANDPYQADPWFADYYCATLAYLMERFKGCRKHFKQRRNGGIGAFTPGQRADLRLGRRQRLPDRRQQSRLQDDRRRQAGGQAPCHRREGGGAASLSRFTRYAEGRTFGDRNSNCPWV